MLASAIFLHAGSLVITQAEAWTAAVSFVIGLLSGLHLERPRWVRGHRE